MEQRESEQNHTIYTCTVLESLSMEQTKQAVDVAWRYMDPSWTPGP